jgi:FkbM family methyltransferase
MRNLLSFVWGHPLNAANRFAAIGRVVRWQVASRLISNPVALPFVDSTTLLVSRGMTGATGNWYCGLHEFRDMAFVLHALRPEDHFVDVGANVGSYTILAASTGARITSVEPIPSTAALLRRNVAMNQVAHRVRIVECGLSDHAGIERFSTDEDTTNHVLVDSDDAAAGLDMPVSTLDEVLGDDVPAVIKIDVEGYERAVLNGSHRTLSASQLLAVIVEMNGSVARYRVNEDDLNAVMRAHGFAPYAYDPFERTLVDSSHADANVVFVRDRAAVESRTRSARRYRMVNGDI